MVMCPMVKCPLVMCPFMMSWGDASSDCLSFGDESSGDGSPGPQVIYSLVMCPLGMFPLVV